MMSFAIEREIDGMLQGIQIAWLPGGISGGYLEFQTKEDAETHIRRNRLKGVVPKKMTPLRTAHGVPTMRPFGTENYGDRR